MQGAVLLDGKNLFHLPMYEIARRVGSVFQNPRTQFYTVNTTSEITFGCENLGMEPTEIARRKILKSSGGQVLKVVLLIHHK